MDPFPVSAPLRERLETAGSEFLVDFFEREVARHPDNLHAWFELGNWLTRLGRFEAGLEVDRKLTTLVPTDPTVHYNLACSLALLSRSEEALAALERSIDLGYDDPEHLLADEDLSSLRGLPRFEALVARLTD